VAVEGSGTEAKYSVSIYPAGPGVTDFDPTVSRSRSEMKLRTISVILNLLPRNYTANDRKITKSELETLTSDIDDIDGRVEVLLKSVPYAMELERSVDQQGSAHPWHTMDVKMTRKAPLAWSAVHGR
jgi:hypothetical protein